MIEQNDGPPASVSLDSRPEYSSAGEWLKNPVLNPFSLADFSKKTGGLDLIARRVCRVYSQILDQKIDRFLLQIFPVNCDRAFGFGFPAGSAEPLNTKRRIRNALNSCLK
ncbi:MAG: hypothetical protein IPO77_15570 [Acidobacteria bacterium]|nr:hypothetical protein [Acidobacteriota bacterium]